MKKVLFLCTGNYYRSRFAEVFFNWLAQKRRLAWMADSCGLRPDPANAGPISCHTVMGLSRLGVPDRDRWREPRRAMEADFRNADLVIAVKEAEHRTMLSESFPAWLERVEFWHVHDLDCAQPHETLAELEQRVIDLIERLALKAAAAQP